MTALAPEATRPAAGTVRRLQALAVAGWPFGRLARESGLTPYRINQMLTEAPATVTADEARAVAAVYARYSGASPGLCGVSHIHARAARDRATAAGWAPPAAWDDDTIDDPNATPDLGAETPRPQGGAGRPFADVVEDVEDILSWEPYTTATELAHRLGYRDSSGIQIALRRGERTDLLAQLARNAEVAA